MFGCSVTSIYSRIPNWIWPGTAFAVAGASEAARILILFSIVGVSRARDDRFREQEIIGNARRRKVSVSRRRNTLFQEAIITSLENFTQLGAETAKTLAKA